MQLDNATIKRLKGIGHDLKPIVMIGNKGVTPSITEEIDRALSDHELIKVKLPAGTKEERDVIGAELATTAKATLVHSIGRMALLLRKNPNANPKLPKASFWRCASPKYSITTPSGSFSFTTSF